MKVYLGKYPKHRMWHNYLPEVFRPKKVEFVHIDKYDSWDAFSTIAKIAYPVVKQLRESTNSYFNTDQEDIPEYLRKYFDDYESYEWVMGEILFALEHIANGRDSTELFYSESPIHERGWKKSQSVFSGSDYWICVEGYRQHEERVQRGCVFFGKYFQNLWD